MKIRGNAVGTTMKRPDWEQKNERASDFIRNKPVTIPPVTTRHNDMHLKVVDGAWTPVYECADGSSYMFVTDSERAYEKTIPSQAMGKAMIDKIGGGPAYIAPVSRANTIDFNTFVSEVAVYPEEARVNLKNRTFAISCSLTSIVSMEEYSIHIVYRPTCRSTLLEVAIGGVRLVPDQSSWEEKQTYKWTFRAQSESRDVVLFFKNEDSLATNAGSDVWILVHPTRTSSGFREYVPKVDRIVAYKKNYVGPTYPLLPQPMTKNGVTFTPMPNGDIILNGIAEKSMSLLLYGNENEGYGPERLYLKPGDYYVLDTGDPNAYFLLKRQYSGGGAYGTMPIALSDQYSNIGYVFHLRVKEGGSFNNAVFHPWIVKGSDPSFVSVQFTVPHSVLELDGYGEEGNYYDLERHEFVNTKTGKVTSFTLAPDISGPINELVDVEPGGTIVFENELKRPVDSEVTYQIKV
jgi:hypothetical protein